MRGSILGQWGNKVKSTIYIQFRLVQNTHTSVFLDNNSMNLLLNSTHGHAPSNLAVYGNFLYYWGINTQSYCDYSFYSIATQNTKTNVCNNSSHDLLDYISQ